MVPHGNGGNVINESNMKTDFKETYKFLSGFKTDLESRKFYGQSIKGKYPFYTLFQVNANTFSKYKVIWKSIAGKISGKPDFNCAVTGVLSSLRQLS